MQHNSAIIVVVYNKKIEDSTTIKTISKYDFGQSILIIHNNGPENINLTGDVKLALEKSFKSVSVENCLSNLPLSIVYNNFIYKYNGAEQFVILDDDSTITESFALAIRRNDVDIELPRIVSRVDNVVYYPNSLGEVITSDAELDARTAFSIGSGMVIKHTVVEKFKNHNLDLFDENYALYGVDFSVFRRISKLIEVGEQFRLKTSSYIEHSLSRAEGQESPFRVKERLIDISITTRRYPTFRMHTHLIKKIFINILFFNFSNVFAILDSYFHGNHPRCR